MEDFTALYLASDKLGVTKSGFASEDDAMEYIASQMCQSCQMERKRALRGDKIDEEGRSLSCYPSCTYEWRIVPTRGELP